MTVEIDESTGLPKLPGGEIWRVQGAYPTCVYWMSSLRPGKWGYWREDKGTPEEPGREYERREGRWLWHWAWLVKMREVRSRLREDREVVEYMPLPQDFDQSNVIEAATYLVEKFERTNAQHALYGDYPPKRLQP